MFQKNLLLLCVFLFWSCSNAYLDFHAEKDTLKTAQEITKNFDLSQVEDISNIEIFPTPDETVLDMIVQYINQAQKYVYLEMYILSEKRIQNALLEAQKR